MTHPLDQLADRIAKEATENAVVLGPEKDGEFIIYFVVNRQIQGQAICYDFNRNVKKKYRTRKIARDAIATVFAKRHMNVAIVNHDSSLGHAFHDFFPHLMNVEHPAHETLQ